MSTEMTPYIKRNPGDLVTAEDWNDVQKQIRKDIQERVDKAIHDLKKVDNAENAHKLDNQTSDELTEDILEKARRELPTRTGYRSYYKKLKAGEVKEIEHRLGAFPLVDVYFLELFPARCSEDDDKHDANVTFYFYHSSEQRFRALPNPAPADPSVKLAAPQPIDVEPPDGRAFRIRFSELLALYHVNYNDASILEDLESEFWQAFTSPPNDRFVDDDVCHSPWFDRCCGERRTVANLKQSGSWDEIYFKFVPKKTVILASPLEVHDAPSNIQVVQYDFNTIGVKNLATATAGNSVNLLVIAKV